MCARRLGSGKSAAPLYAYDCGLKDNASEFIEARVVLRGRAEITVAHVLCLLKC